MLRIAFIQAVDFPFLLDFYVSIHQDELADGLKEKL